MMDTIRLRADKIENIHFYLDPLANLEENLPFYSS